MTSNKKMLFEDSDDGEDIGNLNINKSYAAKYEEWRRGEELQKLKDRFGDEDLLSSESESSSDDEYVEPDNPEFDREFFRTLGALHNKKVAIQEENFFKDEYGKKREKKGEKPMTIKDYERQMILEGKGEIEEDDNKEWKGGGKLGGSGKGGAFDDGGVSSEDDEGDGDLFSSGLFTVKEEDKNQEERQEDDTVAFIKGETTTTVANTKDKEYLQGLKEAWSNPKMSKKDKWLADFFLNKRYLEDEDEAVERAYNQVVIDEETLSEDEETLHTMETFETKYRFRFEEPDQEFLKKYPRVVQDSVRAKDERRKLHREAVRERKLKEKELKKQELIKLKELKLKEIEAKIEKIKEASGNQDIDLGFQDKDFEEDFDPENHDRAMAKIFGDDYYTGEEECAEKPVFSDDDNEIIKDYDDWLEKEGPEAAGGGRQQEKEEEQQQQQEEWQEDQAGDWQFGDDFIMDADYLEGNNKETLKQEMMAASSKKKVRKKTKFARAIGRRKPVFNPEEKTFDSYFDEYYQLNFEDIVGGMPCRFKYRKVEKNNFGLSTEEILTAQDKELNRWYSVKKMLSYDRTNEQEKRERGNYAHRCSQLHIKQKILPSLFVENPVEHHISEEEKKRLKNLKKKLRRQKRELGLAEDEEVSVAAAADSTHHTTARQKRPLADAGEEAPQKKKHRQDEESQEDVQNEGKKKQSLNNANYTLDADEGLNVSSESLHGSPKKTKKKKKKKLDEEQQQGAEGKHLDTDKTTESQMLIDVPEKKFKAQDNANNVSEGSSHQTKKKKKKNKNKIKDVNIAMNSYRKEKAVLPGISDARLEAYGENPKKLKNKVKYGKKKLQ